MKCDLRKLGWGDELASGFEEIDRQHQNLLRLLREFSNNLALSVDSEQFTDFLLEFSSVTANHFEFEENLLAKIGYHGLEQHKKEHEEILNRLADVAMSAVEHSESTILEFIDALCDWFEKHLAKEDTQYFAFLQNKKI